MPAGFYVLKKNINASENVWGRSIEIPLYLKKNVTPKEVADLVKNLKLNDAIMGLELISPDEGIKDFAKRTGFGEILLGIKGNPLPNVIIVYPQLSQLSESKISVLIDSLKNIPEVDVAKIDMDWVGHSHRLLSLLSRLSLILSLLLGVGALEVVCCVAYIIPQTVMSKINPSRLVLQYQCFWYSLIGGLLALLLINFILMALHNLGFTLQGAGLRFSIVFILFGVLLSVVSAKFAMQKNSNLRN